MNISHLMHSMTGDLKPAAAKSIELRPGQVIRATLLQSAGDGESLLLIQNAAVRARVEGEMPLQQTVPVQVVAQGKDGAWVLRPLFAADKTISLASLLSQFGLPDEASHRLMLSMMQQSGIVLNKANVNNMLEALALKPDPVPAAQWISAAVYAMHKQLPLTAESVQALRQTLYGPPLADALSRLAADIAAIRQTASFPQHATPTYASVLAAISRTMDGIAHHASALQSADDNITHTGSHSTGANSRTTGASSGTAGQTSTHLPGITAYAAGRTSVLPGGSGLAVTVSAHQVGLVSSASETMSPTLGAATKWERGGLTPPATAPVTGERAVNADIIQASARNAGEGGRQANAVRTQTGGFEPLPSVLQTTVPSTSTTDGRYTSIYTAPQGGALPSAQATHATSAAPSLAPSSSETQSPPIVLRILQALGLDYERSLFMRPSLHPNAIGQQAANAASPADLPNASETLKGLLMQLLTLEEAPPSLRESAQSLVQHITGQQLMMTGDRAAWMNQLTMLIPILNEQGEQTAAVTIQSRRDRRGAIDASNCRLLFDLQLGEIGNTIVDVKVEDKQVFLKILNDFPYLSALVESGRPQLRAALAEHGFQLGSVQMDAYPNKSDTKEKQDAGTHQTSPQSLRIADLYKGVDLRV